jgi:O-antigen/teichoic acid export membrane protein
MEDLVADRIPIAEEPAASVPDRSWAADRARVRHRRAAITSAASLAARGSALVSLVVSVPLVLHSVGAERCGVWLTLASLVALLGFADLGLGNGLVNAAARATGEDDDDALRAAVASTFYLLVSIAVVLAVVFAIGYPFVPWADLVNAHGASIRAEVAPAVSGLVALFLVGLPLRVVDRTQTALQQGFYPNLWQALGNVLGLVGLALAVREHASLEWLVWTPLLGLLLSSVANWVTFFGVVRRDLLPRPHLASRASSRHLFRLGVSFFVLQIAVAVSYQTDTLVIAQVLGPTAVQQYAVPMRLFLIPSTLMGLLLAPLWPAYSEALARGDQAWVMKTLRRTIILATGTGTLAATALVLSAPWLIRVWVGHAVAPTALLLVALGAWLVAMSLTGPISVFLNGASVLGPQAVGSVVMMLANLGLSIYLAGAVGVSGVVWGTVLSQVAFFLGPAIFFVRRHAPSVRMAPAL